MGFSFSTYSGQIASLGRELTPQMLAGAREGVQAYLDMAPFPDVNIQRDVSYGPDERHRLDIFTPTDKATVRPVLVYIHGGGFVMGDKYAPGTPFFDNVGAWAVRNGLAAVTMTYRLAPGATWPSGIEDVRLAMNLLQEHASDFGLDPANIFLAGHSAGACHASNYLSHSHLYAPAKPGFKGLVLLSGIYDFEAYEPSDKEIAYLGHDTSRYGEFGSLASLVETDLPLLVAVAEHDPLMFQQQYLSLVSRRLERHGTLTHSVYMTGQNHLSGILMLGLEGDVLGPQILEFIHRHRN